MASNFTPFGCSLRTCTRWLAACDVIVGCIKILVLAMVFLDVSKPAEGSGIAWVVYEIASGPIAVLGGFIGLVGLQKRSIKYITRYMVLKAIQMILVFLSVIIMLLSPDEKKIFHIWLVNPFLFGGYALYILKKLRTLMTEGEPVGIVTVAEMVDPNIQFITPFLHGESPRIPVRLN